MLVDPHKMLMKPGKPVSLWELQGTPAFWPVTSGSESWCELILASVLPQDAKSGESLIGPAGPDACSWQGKHPR